MRSSANKQRKLHARWLTARSCRDGSLRGPAAMVACAVLPRWSLRGPAAMVAARSCRDGRCAVLPRWSLRGPAAMARCAVLPRWLTARSCRDGRCAVLPRCVFQTWKRPRRRYAVFRPARSSRERPYVSKNDARARSPVSGFLSRSAMWSATCQG